MRKCFSTIYEYSVKTNSFSTGYNGAKGICSCNTSAKQKFSMIHLQTHSQQVTMVLKESAVPIQVRNSDLKEHIESVHSKLKQIKCKNCECVE